nr:copia protein [Tanacetum cinerariifolium]
MAPVTILNTLDPLGKFQGKVDEGFIVGYSVCRFKDLNAEFEECNNNNSNGVNAASSLVSTAGQNFINNTNDFSAAGPSNAAMPNLENITHSDDAYDVALCQSFKKLMKDKFQMSSMGELTFFLDLQVKQKKDGIFISQDKYVGKILKKFGLTEGKSASTPIDVEKPLLKDSDGEDVDVHTYMSMIGSLMCKLRQKIYNWRMSIPWMQIDFLAMQQTVVATSLTEAEYVAATSGYAQVLWIQNQLLDYGDSLLLGVNTPRSDEDRLKLMELMVFLLQMGICVEIRITAARL